MEPSHIAAVITAAIIFVGAVVLPALQQDTISWWTFFREMWRR